VVLLILVQFVKLKNSKFLMAYLRKPHEPQDGAHARRM